MVLSVFVYGTLKPGEVNYPRYCAGKVLEQQAAFTWGELYDLILGYPGMTAGEEKVQGTLLKFADDSPLSQLDQLEGYHPHRPAAENEYQRYQVPVYDLQANPLGEAWAYFMSLERIKKYQGQKIASGWWGRKREESASDRIF
ncbi:MAG: gamma-glutamylcyclotransferase [Kamptonema sp. SIO4C4]|nr:gamma-glutamylcyclotransferase [Kamptonema sp. SIO4C4]